MKTRFHHIILIFCFISCSEDESQLAYCHDTQSCIESEFGSFCTFGYKWGGNPRFFPNGLEINGPGVNGGDISYSFQTFEHSIHTSFADGVQTLNFDVFNACVRTQVVMALQEWAKYGDFNFVEEEDESDSQIKFIAAKIDLDGYGTPNYEIPTCHVTSGRVFFSVDLGFSCDEFYILALHEIGHALGLGHVDSENIMSPKDNKYKFNALQPGDIEGIVSVYGSK